MIFMSSRARSGASAPRSRMTRLPVQALDGGEGGPQAALLVPPERRVFRGRHAGGELGPHAGQGACGRLVEPVLELDHLVEKGVRLLVAAPAFARVDEVPLGEDDGEPRRVRVGSLETPRRPRGVFSAATAIDGSSE